MREKGLYWKNLISIHFSSGTVEKNRDMTNEKSFVAKPTFLTISLNQEKINIKSILKFKLTKIIADGP